MKFAFVWWWGRAKEIYPNWRDGLRAALEVLSNKFPVDMFLGELRPKNEYDFILFWGDSNCEFFNGIEKYKAKKGIILTTDPVNFDNLRKLDVVFCESTPVYEAVKAQGLRAIKAFATDTNFYSPLKTDRDIPYFYPATFSLWKRQSKIAYLGNKLTCIGTLQPDGKEELEACQKAGVNVEIGYFPPEKIRNYYDRANHVIIPAIHGSERTVLEAMSMGLLPRVIGENRRTYSYLQEFFDWSMKMENLGKWTREFVLENYSPKIYAKNLLKGIYD